MAMPPGYFSVADVRKKLELSDSAGPEVERIINQAILNAQAAVEGYIQGPLMPTAMTKAFDLKDNPRELRFYLDHCPIVSVDAVKIDNVAVTTGFRVSERLAKVTFDSLPSGDELVIEYTAGVATGTPTPVLPDDIEGALLNITLALYSLGGSFASVSTGTGSLKSLTMFDAMSMSFDTGDSGGSSTSVAGMLSQWSFVLDRYKMQSPVMA